MKGRRLEIDVTAADVESAVKVGEGVHVRFVVNTATFLAKAGVPSS